MAILTINEILLYMENNDLSLEEAIQQLEIDGNLVTDTVRKEIDRQTQLHNENIARQEGTPAPTEEPDETFRND